MKPVAVFDLDDTLIDTRMRQYSIVSAFLRRRGLPARGYDAYLTLRINHRLTNSEVVRVWSGSPQDDFQQYWLNEIERPGNLAMDVPRAAPELLSLLREHVGCSLMVLSLRSNKTAALQQFRAFSFAAHFTTVRFLPHRKNKNPKTSVLRSLRRVRPVCFFIGDSEPDLIAARDAGVRFFGVRTGVRPPQGCADFTDVNSFILSLVTGEGRERATGDNEFK